MKIPGLQALARDRFFHLLLIIGAALSLFVPFAPRAWPAAIDWRTIITLSGLMMLTKGVELSGYFDVLGRKWCAALPPSAGCPCLWCSPPRCCRRF
ncbi:membrane protein [Enterobacter asburiae]|nr:membrane protein [Enterobacter asburiae]